MGSNIDDMLKVISNHNIAAIFTGHWHCNAQWYIEPGNMLQISTGPLCGWGWNGIPPAPRFGLRPGYRLFCYSKGILHTFWRELGAAPQVNISYVGGMDTAGPRPLVRKMHIGKPVELQAQTMSLDKPIRRVEWAAVYVETIDIIGREHYRVHHPGWCPLEQTLECMWSNWQGTVDLAAFDAGEAILMVRACQDETHWAYDAVPIVISKDGAVWPIQCVFFCQGHYRHLSGRPVNI